MDKEVVKELIQDDLTVENLKKELKKILPGEERQTQIENDYTILKKLLQQQNNASQTAASIIVNFVKLFPYKKLYSQNK
jgi:lipid-A-disaccharide synthase